jgi:hypothetical protein
MSQNGETFTLLRGVQAVEISDLVTYRVCEFDGLGMAPVRRLSQRGPLQNGETDVGYRLDPRTIRLVVLGAGATPDALHSLRETVLGLLRPGADPIRLRWEYSGKARQIDVHYVSGLSLPSTDWRLSHHRLAFELRAPDPTLYDPNTTTVGLAASGGGTGLPLPMLFPMTLGASNLDTIQAINLSEANAWETFPTITITGPVTDLVITNNATGDKLDFTGTTIGNGVTYTLDLRYGYKTVIDQAGANQISKLTSDSDLATWSLVPGSNSIRATGLSVSSATAISIQYNARFIGV